MRVAGFAVGHGTKGRPLTRLIVIDSSDPSMPLTSATFTGDDVDLATQLHDAAEAVRSSMEGNQADRAVVRRADRPTVASKAEGPRLRLLTEGSIVAAARSIIVETWIGTGKETGKWHGTNKATLDAAATAFLVSAGLPAVYLDAAAAALAGLALP
jgi:hypothetical protein